MCVNVHEITIQDTSLQIASGQLVLIRWHELTAKGTVMRGCVCVCVYTTTINAHNDSHGNAEHTKYKQTAKKKMWEHQLLRLWESLKRCWQRQIAGGRQQIEAENTKACK